jgi:uncharacterized membrane protein
MEFLRSCLAGLPTKLHWVFLFPAIPLVIFLALWTPPFQSADEFAHFDRAWQVAHGQLYATSGGFIDAGAEELHAYVADLPFHPEARFSPANRAGAEAVKWTRRLTYDGFPNTGTCAPTGYLPQALGILFGEATGMGVMQTLALARLFNGAFSILVCVLALYWCGRGKVVMFAILLMPMTLSLFASASQDATLIAFTALAFALTSKQIEVSAPLTLSRSAVLALSLLIVSLGRPPYAALLLVLITPCLFPRWRNISAWLPGGFLASLVAAVTLFWWLGTFAATRAFAYPSAANGVVNPKLQLLNLFHEPVIVVSLAGFAVRHAAEYIAGMIGILGWLDTLFPASYYLAMVLVVLMACIAELAHGKTAKKSLTFLLLASPFATIVAIFLIEYLIWTPVGVPAIYGVQGRYFIPPAIAAGVGLPSLSESAGTYQWATVVIVLSQLLTLVSVPQVIMGRYYLP